MPSVRVNTKPPVSPRDWIWQAPLVPVAVSATIGLVLDRYVGVPSVLNWLLLAACAIAWLVALLSQRKFAPVFLWLAAGLLAAQYHHLHRHAYADDDIGHFATDEPKLVRLRGVLVEGPTTYLSNKSDPLVAFLRPDATYAVVETTAIETQNGWQPITGKLRLGLQGVYDHIHCGDSIEFVGWLQTPPEPANPGEWNRREMLRDRRILAEVHVRKSADAVSRTDSSWSLSTEALFSKVRHWGSGALQRRLPPEKSRIAQALLLGENSAMESADWDRYIRTGVVHVLVISGQHLVILAFFFWIVLRFAGVSRRRGALFVAAILIAYALMTGFRPSTARATVTVVAACIALTMRRQVLPANVFALAWLFVIALDPTDAFNMGCQLAFVQVAVMTWGIHRWLARDDDPVEQLVAKSRSRIEQLARTFGRLLMYAYALSFILGLVSMPLVAARQHVVTPAGWLIGPPMVLLSSVAIVAGFLLIFTEAISSVLSMPFAWITRWSLAGCDSLIDIGEKTPLACFYVPDLPLWLLWGYYLSLLATLWGPSALQNWRWPAVSTFGWFVIGIIALSWPKTSDELRVTFLAVGHGGCTVLETPDGCLLVYDAGAIRGPEVSQHTIAPYLWSRGRRRIDELFLSHADLDHFNGVIALMERFDIGQITCTPSFADKQQAGVRKTLDAIESRGIPIRIVHARDLLSAGDVTLRVLHPPPQGPDGPENVRSMVLYIRHESNSILLTGDVEGAGLGSLMETKSPKIDVLMAPHHGSRIANTPTLARWASPRLVVACQGPPRGAQRRDEPYSTEGTTYWGTWPHGAITVQSSRFGLRATTFRTKLELEIASKSRGRTD